MIGNIHFETTTAQGQKMKKSRPGFRAVLSPGRSASDHPLFFSSEDGDGENRCQGLFTAKPITRWPWKGKGKGGYTWFDSEGEQVAVEGDGEGECERKLAITVSMRRDLRDVLVALWMLRLWFETAESKRARREGNHISPCRVHACIQCQQLTISALERMMPPPTSSDMKLVKRTGALGAVAAGGC